MSLDIGIGRDDGPVPDPNELQLHLDDECNFLYPWLLARKTRQMIDPYGDARFSGLQLQDLKLMIQEIREEVTRQSDSVEIVSNCEIQVSVRRDRVVPRPTIRKTRLVEILTTWEDIIERAEKTNRPVVCFGD
jgi:hypothetical protein